MARCNGCSREFEGLHNAVVSSVPGQSLFTGAEQVPKPAGLKSCLRADDPYHGIASVFSNPSCYGTGSKLPLLKPGLHGSLAYSTTTIGTSRRHSYGEATRDVDIWLLKPCGAETTMKSGLVRHADSIRRMVRGRASGRGYSWIWYMKTR